jgi:hypothetical protein
MQVFDTIRHLFELGISFKMILHTSKYFVFLYWNVTKRLIDDNFFRRYFLLIANEGQKRDKYKKLKTPTISFIDSWRY